ncbi:MAG TPA: hypothetical protein VF365_08895 [Candidatus Limnocylindria bacterium]
MSDLHERFGAWLTDGARVELPRDVALHASACDACVRDAAAFDALLAIEPGAAPLPPLRAGRPPRAIPTIPVLRAAVGVAAVVALGVSVGIGTGALLDPRMDVASTLTSPTPDGEGILAGAGGPSATPSLTDPTATGSGAPSESPEASEPEASQGAPRATPAPGASTPRPIVTPRPTSITPPIGTPRPSSSSAATPAPTAQPSVPPSATPPVETEPPPTPEPTPVPTLAATPEPSAATPPPSESP